MYKRGEFLSRDGPACSVYCFTKTTKLACIGRMRFFWMIVKVARLGRRKEALGDVSSTSNLCFDVM